MNTLMRNMVLMCFSAFVLSTTIAAHDNVTLSYRRIQKIPKEEAATVGLNYNTLSNITENDIRKEHGLSLRGTH